MTTAIVFILMLGLLILAHELGHFIAAKKAGIKIEEFGFGFPPRIFGKKIGETIYSINLLPLGGFVKIFGEDGDDQKQPRSFTSLAIWKRMIIISAGVFMNLVLAAILLSVGFMIGLPEAFPDEAEIAGAQVQINQVAADSPAQQAGLLPGDIILSLSYQDQPVEIVLVEQVQNFSQVFEGQEVVMTIQRGQDILTKEITPRVDYPENEGRLGIGLARTALVSYPWYKAIYLGAYQTINLTLIIILAFGALIWDLVSSGALTVDVAGPIGIYTLTDQVAQLGLIYIIQFTALISINLAIINALPFPALDGGRFLFLIIEKIKGSPLNQKFERGANFVGFALLILLMIVVTWRDVINNFF